MILFSPIGTADPITALGDGPMLHIVRHYRPIVVVNRPGESGDSLI